MPEVVGVNRERDAAPDGPSIEADADVEVAPPGASRQSTYIRVYLACAGLLFATFLVAWWAGPVSISPMLPYLVFLKHANLMLLGGVGVLVLASPWVTTPWVRRVVETASGVVIAYTAWLLMPALTILLTAVLTPFGGPLRDGELAVLEQALGVPHDVVFRWFEARGALPALKRLYGSVGLQFTFAFVWFGIVWRDIERCWEMNVLLTVTAVIGIPLYLVFPAEGPWVLYAYQDVPPPSFLEDFQAMRSGGEFLFSRFDGFIAFPSYHTVFALLLVYVFRDSWLLVPVVVLNALVLVATYVVGWHYLVDLLGGAVLFAVTVAVVEGLVRWRGSPG